MAKAARGKADDATPIAGFTVSQWQHHMDHDEDWTERLEGASASTVVEIVGALEHAEPTVRALACNLAYALGVSGLGDHAAAAVERLGRLVESDDNKKVRTRARLVHESLAGELQRAIIRRELGWLSAYDPAAHSPALQALHDARDEVRLQTYLWWANASSVPADVRKQAVDELTRQIANESDPVRHRAAEIAKQHLQSKP